MNALTPEENVEIQSILNHVKRRTLTNIKLCLQLLIEKVCFQCGTELIQSNKYCSDCYIAAYCSQSCQKKNWRTHRFVCSLVIHPKFVPPFEKNSPKRYGISLRPKPYKEISLCGQMGTSELWKYIVPQNTSYKIRTIVDSMRLLLVCFINRSNHIKHISSFISYELIKMYNCCYYQQLDKKKLLDTTELGSGRFFYLNADINILFDRIINYQGLILNCLNDNVTQLTNNFYLSVDGERFYLESRENHFLNDKKCDFFLIPNILKKIQDWKVVRKINLNHGVLLGVYSVNGENGFHFNNEIFLRNFIKRSWVYKKYNFSKNDGNGKLYFTWIKGF